MKEEAEESERGEETIGAGNIQTLFLKLSIATQRDLNGDGRGPIRGGGPNRVHPLILSPHPPPALSVHLRLA